MAITLKPVNILGLVLGVAALVAAVCFVIYGVRTGLSAWFILGVVTSILNMTTLGYSFLGPLYSAPDLRRALRCLFVQTWFFVGGAFAISAGRFKIAAICVLGGVSVYVLLARRRIRRLSRRSL